MTADQRRERLRAALDGGMWLGEGDVGYHAYGALLDDLLGRLDRAGLTAPVDPFGGVGHDAPAAVSGILVHWQRLVSKAGDPYGTGTVETDDGARFAVEVFPVPYATYGGLIVESERRTWAGTVDRRGATPKLLVREVTL